MTHSYRTLKKESISLQVVNENGYSKIVCVMIKYYHNNKLRRNPCHREEESNNNHETPGRQTK